MSVHGAQDDIFPRAFGHQRLEELETDDEDEATTRCLSDSVSRRMSRLGKIKKFSKGISTRFNNRMRQLRQKRPTVKSVFAIETVKEHIRGRFERQLAWRSLEADEQLTAIRLSYGSKPISGMFSKPCNLVFFAFSALLVLAFSVESYIAFIEASSVKRFTHYRWVPEVQTPVLTFGMGCSGFDCGPAISQVPPRGQASHTLITEDFAVISHESPFPANLFFLVVPTESAQGLPPFSVEGSLDGHSWKKVWPGTGPWGEGPDTEGASIRPVIRPNSVYSIDWFTAEACQNGTSSLGRPECSFGTLVCKDLRPRWHHHLTHIKRMVACLSILAASMLGACGRPHLARPLLLTSASLYAIVCVFLAFGKLGIKEFSQDWAEAPGVFLVIVGVAACEARFFLWLFVGVNGSIALMGLRGGACGYLDLETHGFVCKSSDIWQLQLSASVVLAVAALTVSCTRRPAFNSDGRIRRFPPAQVYFLGGEGTTAKQELLAFGVVRSIFGIDEKEYRASARKLLRKVMSERSRSSAKSGALMAFGDGFMVKSMSAMEASTLLAILSPYLTHLEKPGGHCTLLPRFFGAYVHVGLFGKQTFLVITANVFADVPPQILATMEKFDLKGSSDDRVQRREGAELMDFDLLRADRKFAAADALQGEEFTLQLQSDVHFLLELHMPDGPGGLLDFGSLPQAYRWAPGLMDYSLLVGLVPRGTPGGLVRLDVRDERVVAKNEAGGMWSVQAREMTVLVGVIDILQFWTPTKRAARLLKKGLGKEHDLDGGYHGEILDTVKPELYAARFLGFMCELFTGGSWLESLPLMYGGDWSRVTALQIHQLPDFQRSKALELQRALTAEVKVRRCI